MAGGGGGGGDWDCDDRWEGVAWAKPADTSATPTAAATMTAASEAASHLPFTN